MRTFTIISFTLLIVVCLAGCAHQPELPKLITPEAPGFFYGLWHGFTALFSLIGSIFTDVRIYAYPNAGGWYDAGFVLGIALFFGGSCGGGTAAKCR